MTTSDRYVAAAYVVFLLVVLSYLLIQSRKLARFERQVEQLERRER
jgi:type II secretory pathway component PulM